MDDLWTGPVTKAGIYQMDEAFYHSDPVPADLGGSLSVSGAKLLLADAVPYSDLVANPTTEELIDELMAEIERGELR